MSQAETVSPVDGESKRRMPTELPSEARRARIDEFLDRARADSDHDQTLPASEQTVSDRLHAATVGDAHLFQPKMSAREQRLTVQRLRVTGSVTPKTEKQPPRCDGQRPLATSSEASASSRASASSPTSACAGSDRGEIKREIARARCTHIPLALAFAYVNDLNPAADSENGASS